MAACLALRAFRMRRRYRTATQLAIARGDPLPNMRDDYWGLGRLSVWTSDGRDAIDGEDMDVWKGNGRRGEKIPEMWEAEVDSEEGTDRWEDTQVRQA